MTRSRVLFHWKFLTFRIYVLDMKRYLKLHTNVFMITPIMSNPLYLQRAFQRAEYVFHVWKPFLFFVYFLKFSHFFNNGYDQQNLGFFFIYVGRGCWRKMCKVSFYFILQIWMLFSFSDINTLAADHKKRRVTRFVCLFGNRLTILRCQKTVRFWVYLKFNPCWLCRMSWGFRVSPG